MKNGSKFHLVLGSARDSNAVVKPTLVVCLQHTLAPDADGPFPKGIPEIADLSAISTVGKFHGGNLPTTLLKEYYNFEKG